MKWTLQLRNPQTGHRALLDLWAQIKPLLIAGKFLIVTVKTDSRSLAQNSLMWSVLEDISTQVKWFGKRMTAEDWKHFITAHLNGQELVPNMDGTGFVALTKGKSTSDMTIAEMTAVIDLGHAFGDDKGVKWRQTSLGRDWPAETTAEPAKQEAVTA